MLLRSQSSLLLAVAWTKNLTLDITSKFHFYNFMRWIQLVLWGMDGFNFSESSMNRLNKTKPAMHCFYVCSVVFIDPFIHFNLVLQWYLFTFKHNVPCNKDIHTIQGPANHKTNHQSILHIKSFPFILHHANEVWVCPPICHKYLVGATCPT